MRHHSIASQQRGWGGGVKLCACCPPSCVGSWAGGRSWDVEALPTEIVDQNKCSLSGGLRDGSYLLPLPDALADGDRTAYKMTPQVVKGLHHNHREYELRRVFGGDTPPNKEHRRSVEGYQHQKSCRAPSQLGGK